MSRRLSGVARAGWWRSGGDDDALGKLSGKAKKCQFSETPMSKTYGPQPVSQVAIDILVHQSELWSASEPRTVIAPLGGEDFLLMLPKIPQEEPAEKELRAPSEPLTGCHDYTSEQWAEIERTLRHLQSDEARFEKFCARLRLIVRVYRRRMMNKSSRHQAKKRINTNKSGPKSPTYRKF